MVGDKLTIVDFEIIAFFNAAVYREANEGFPDLRNIVELPKYEHIKALIDSLNC